MNQEPPADTMLWYLTTKRLENPDYVIIFWLNGEILQFITELKT